MEKLMNKMDNMELDKVSGGIMPYPRPRPRPRPRCHDSNANSMEANVDETQMKLPIGGGHKITMEANVDETQNASACVGK
ncbi:hypothetical protein [Anaerovibrio lipolyticus]|uniref:hypothetical protein n=1 Tax=Anaerovibrio lipolyticus TaxID=82374 RepID=UPI0026F2EFEB|nr:hypothetical protein [Anaerovibrio lipolyticus]MBE6105354.1 hypothetical protein [Anaerovibrio lipolyticus]